MALPKPSAALLKTCKKYKLKTPMHKVFCDLILAGWDKEDAYSFSGLWNNMYSNIMNLQEMNRTMQDESVSGYINEKARETESKLKKAKKEAVEEEAKQLPEIDMATELSKEAQLKELLVAKQKHPVGSKEWLDIKKMIADISRVKQDDIQDEEEVVHFYVPIQCHNCSLYMAQKAKQERANKK
jgi:hypothetical protein